MAMKCLMEKAARKPKFGVRAYNRFKLCGRRHAYMRKFGGCRLGCRELAVNGLIPGVTKARGNGKELKT